MLMKKTETIHARVTPEIKKQAEAIFQSVGLTTSQAITLFLKAAVNHNGLPFSLNIPTDVEKELNFATAISKVDGLAPSKGANEIIRSFIRNDIDYETALKMIKKMKKN